MYFILICQSVTYQKEKDFTSANGENKESVEKIKGMGREGRHASYLREKPRKLCTIVSYQRSNHITW